MHKCCLFWELKKNLLTPIVKDNNTDSQPSHQTSNNSLNESFVVSLTPSLLHPQFSSSGEGLKYVFIQFLEATMKIVLTDPKRKL